MLLEAHGVETSVLEEVNQVRESTLRTWLTRGGEHGRKLHDRFFRNLHLDHVQLDELWGHVKRSAAEVWVWTITEVKTKIIPVPQVGERSQAMAYSVLHELKSRLADGCLPIFSSDGLKHYFYAITAHFGLWHQTRSRQKNHLDGLALITLWAGDQTPPTPKAGQGRTAGTLRAER